MLHTGSAYLCGLHLQLLYGQGLPLQAAGADREQLLEALDVLLHFAHGLGGHPADVLLNLLLLLHKLSARGRGMAMGRFGFLNNIIA